MRHAPPEEHLFPFGQLERFVKPGAPWAGGRNIVVVVEQQRKRTATSAPPKHDRRSRRSYSFCAEPGLPQQVGNNIGGTGKFAVLTDAGRLRTEALQIAEEPVNQNACWSRHGGFP
jgi:hypothetical protein